MGAGASTPNLRKQLDQEALKPADVNDITTLPEAKAELRRLRSQLKALKDTVRREHRGGGGSTGHPGGRLTPGWRKDACCDRGGLDSVRCCRRLAVCACSARLLHRFLGPPSLKVLVSTHPAAFVPCTYAHTHAHLAQLFCSASVFAAVQVIYRSPNIDL